MPDSPAGPPSPPIPLAELLAREDLGLRRIAGPGQADLLWVHTSEMADPYPYLLGGELLLTAGVQLTDADTYVARLVQAGAAALGFGVAPVYDTVPAALVEACDRHGLPLLEVPPETRVHRDRPGGVAADGRGAPPRAAPGDPGPAGPGDGGRPPGPGTRGAAAARRAAGGPGRAAHGGRRGTARGGRAPGTGCADGPGPAGPGGGPPPRRAPRGHGPRPGRRAWWLRAARRRGPGRKPSPSSATDTRAGTHLFGVRAGRRRRAWPSSWRRPGATPATTPSRASPSSCSPC